MSEYVLCVPANMSPLKDECWDDFAKRRGTFLVRDMAEGNEAWRQIGRASCRERVYSNV